jgi:hypothetical protein
MHTKIKPIPQIFAGPQQFVIELSPTMYKVLSSGLYSDPIRAIIREYSTNAADAHIAAGQTKPFDVHLPTEDDPYFWIRDYGTGMSHETVQRMWKSFGSSTKQSDNTQVGKFGLGSKCALSYTQAFSLTSYYNGQRFQYMSGLSANGIPHLYCEKEPQSTKEPNGLLIRIKVNKNDIETFCKTASSIYSYFEIKPNFVGLDCYIAPIDYIFTGECGDFRYGLRPVHTSHDYKKHTNRLIIGGICYDIPKYTDDTDDDTDDDIDDNLCSGYADLYVNNGEFEPTPSRENIHWDTDAVNKVKQFSLAVKENVESHFHTLSMKSPVNRVFECINLRRNGLVRQLELCCTLLETSINEFDQSKGHLTISYGRYDDDACIYLNVKNEKVKLTQLRDKNQRSYGYRCNKSAIVIKPDKPVQFILIDCLGLKKVIDSMDYQANVLFVGTPVTKDDIDNMFADSGLCYTVKKLSDVKGDLVPTYRSNGKAAGVKTKSNFPGCFERSCGMFNSISDITNYGYYVPFSSETKFELSHNYSESAIAQLRVLFGYKKDVVFIRPRFLSDYVKQYRLINFEDAVTLEITKRYEDDFVMFLVRLEALIYGGGKLCKCIVPDFICRILDQISRLPKQWHECSNLIRYPFLQRLVCGYTRYIRGGHRYGTRDIRDKACITLRNERNSIYQHVTATIGDEVFDKMYQEMYYLMQSQSDCVLRSFPYALYNRDDLLITAMFGDKDALDNAKVDDVSNQDDSDEDADEDADYTEDSEEHQQGIADAVTYAQSVPANRILQPT